MANLVVSVVTIYGILSLLCIAPSSALSDNVFADVYHSTRGKGRTGSLESTGSVGSGVNIGSGIYRGEASIYTSETDDQPSKSELRAEYTNRSGGKEASTDSPGEENQVPWSDQASNAVGGVESKSVFSGGITCEEGTESLLAINEDIRFEMSAIDLQYLENASIEDVCDRNGEISNCKFDFQLYPSDLQIVCQNHGGDFYQTEHSIQCHNQNTMESLYYQFDNYPSCFSVACDHTDAGRLVGERIDSITQEMSKYLGIPCFADDDILRYANDASLFIDSSGSGRSLHWFEVRIFSVATFLLIRLT